MGNLCSKTAILTPPKCFNNNSSQCDHQISSKYDFELIYAPETGEGESLKVLFAYLGIPLREVICPSAVSYTHLTLPTNREV